LPNGWKGCGHDSERGGGLVTVIAIQSQGNSAAVFPLQACGIEVASIRGGVLDAELVRDPVMGDADLGFYVNEDNRALFGKALSRLRKSLLQTSLNWSISLGARPQRLKGWWPPPAGLGSRRCRDRRAFPGAAADIALAIEPRAAWMVATPRLASQPGDLFTARLAAALVEACRPRPPAAPFPVSMGFSKKQCGGGNTRWRWWLPRSARSPLRAIRYPATRGCSALAGSSRRIPMTSVAMLKRIPQ
jgi:hypothetical protein